MKSFAAFVRQHTFACRLLKTIISELSDIFQNVVYRSCAVKLPAQIRILFRFKAKLLKSKIVHVSGNIESTKKVEVIKEMAGLDVYCIS